MEKEELYAYQEEIFKIFKEIYESIQIATGFCSTFTESIQRLQKESAKIPIKNIQEMLDIAEKIDNLTDKQKEILRNLLDNTTNY